MIIYKQIHNIKMQLFFIGDNLLKTLKRDHKNKTLSHPLASNGNVADKGLADEGKQQIYGKLPTESLSPSQGYKAISSDTEKAPTVEEEVNPLYINETWKSATTKSPTKTKQRSTTKEREPLTSIKTVSNSATVLEP